MLFGVTYTFMQIYELCESFCGRYVSYVRSKLATGFKAFNNNNNNELMTSTPSRSDLHRPQRAAAADDDDDDNEPCSSTFDLPDMVFF